MSRISDLRYFAAAEFREWYEHMSLRELFLLDTFRHQWGAPVEISPNASALGRKKGEAGTTQHNVDRWREVRAADLFPHWIETRADAERAVIIATRVGFTGIGIYPDWQLGTRTVCGMHLDVRVDREPGEPAKWGGIDDGDGQRYVALHEAMQRLPGGRNNG